MTRAHRTLWSLMAGLSLLVGTACRDRVVPKSPDFVEYGWELFAEGDLRGALVQFVDGVTAAEGRAGPMPSWAWRTAASCSLVPLSRGRPIPSLPPSV